MQDFQAFPVLASAGLALGAAWLMASGRIPSPLAQPNDRSLHRHPIPRTGGLAIWAGWLGSLAAGAWAAGAGYAALALGLVAAVSLADDWRALPAWLRLAVHALAAGVAAWAALDPPGAGWLVAELLVVAWMANLYNFMDGSDGLAGAMGVFGFGAYAAGLALAGRPDLATSHAALAAACAGFLAFNLPPARLFMGDVGAVGLGFLAGLSGLQGIVAGAWPWWFPPLVFAPFVIDATVTLIRRVLRGENPARAHREHFYQRAILADGAHGRTLAAYAGWMAACAALALAGLRWAGDQGAFLLLGTALAFGAWCRRIDRRWARRPEAAN